MYAVVTFPSFGARFFKLIALRSRMAYIEENLKIRRQQQDASEKSARDATDEFSLSERWKSEKKATDEGSVTNSLAMLTAIPEVDLGMECVVPLLSMDGPFIRSCSSRLRNIEETEKAKRQVAEERKERKKVNNDEEHLVATRCTSPFLLFFGGRMPQFVAQFTVRI